MSSVHRRASWRRIVGQAALGAVVAAAAGCGGGDSAGQPPATAVAAEPAALTGATTCNLPHFTASLLARVNQARAAGASCGTAGNFGAAPPVAWNDRLAQAAAGHSQDMADHNYFSHTSQDGRTLGPRVDATGYAWSALGENIAAGQPTVESVVAAWMGSPGHCANIMRADFSEMGVACVPGTPADAYITYWTMDLGRSR